jgi:hypothetical protein
LRLDINFTSHYEYLTSEDLSRAALIFVVEAMQRAERKKILAF